jgi:uncharacterized membrane protein YgcG
VWLAFCMIFTSHQTTHTHMHNKFTTYIHIHIHLTGVRLRFQCCSHEHFVACFDVTHARAARALSLSLFSCSGDQLYKGILQDAYSMLGQPMLWGIVFQVQSYDPTVTAGSSDRSDSPPASSVASSSSSGSSGSGSRSGSGSGSGSARSDGRSGRKNTLKLARNQNQRSGRQRGGEQGRSSTRSRSHHVRKPSARERYARVGVRNWVPGV